MAARLGKKFGIMGILVALVAAGSIVRHHLYRVKVWNFSSKPVGLWTVPFGSWANQLTRVKGLDGDIYGPLAFVVRNGQPAIADTYGHRIVVNIHPWRTVATEGLLPEDLVGTARTFFFADNRTLAIYRVSTGNPRKIIQFSQSPGYTEVIWHLATDGNTLVVEGVKLGQGQCETWLRQYSGTGQLLHTLNLVRSGHHLPMKSPSSHPITVPVRSFTVSPSRQLVVEVAGNEKYQRVFQVYNADNRVVRQAELIAPEAIVHSQLLGVNRMGWIYAGINLAKQGEALVAVLRPGRRTIFRKVHSVPVASAVYGAVSPNGSLYLLQSTTKEYRIVKWALMASEHWSWNGRIVGTSAIPFLKF
ncbi:MAG: hypothetical protein M1294_05940 [Firmicutes bacterium]|jgi:hypothetical protein|uniref:Uncharacterized protein n=1 Tax=Sulfobacillus benefaciens TaxID=453960 RepID=A0A2T2X8S5_9FIRM|nr:hypothetical protein [Bacillota bacterium]MCL5014318.1 hypothetical protein [Bacillota bacterium]PSR30913.1 MAG: hypothetical protein C7B43_04480 [Sulfobacillus benefaciens]